MKLRFDFTKTDNTIMSSNVIDLPTTDIKVMSEELIYTTTITNVMRTNKRSKAEMMFISPNTESDVGHPFVLNCGDVSYSDLIYLNVFIALGDDHMSGILQMVGFTSNSGFIVRAFSIDALTAPIIAPLNSKPVSAYYTLTEEY